MTKQATGTPAPPTSSTQAIRGLLIVAQPIYALGIKAILEQSQRHVVCGQSADLPAAAQLIGERSPDVVLMDSTIDPPMSLLVLEEVNDLGLAAKVLVLGDDEHPAVAMGPFLRLGAADYLNKADTDAQVLLTAVKAVGEARC